MKFYLAVILLQLAVVIFAQDKELIEEIAAKLRVKLQTGDPAIGLAPADPYLIQSLQQNVTNPYFTGTVDLNKCQLKGMSGFILENVSFSMAADGKHTHLVMNFPKLTMDGNLGIHGTVLNSMPLNQENHCTFHLSNATIDVNLNDDEKHGHYQIEEMKPQFFFQSPAIVADGDNSDFMNSILSMMSGQTIDAYVVPFLEQQFNKYFKPMLNRYLEDI